MGLKGLRRGYNPTVSHLYIFYIQWTPVNTVNYGPKKSGSINGVAVLTRFFFYNKMYGGFYQAAKKSGRNNEVAVSRGFTVKKSLEACETLYETLGLNKLTGYFWLNKSCS